MTRRIRGKVLVGAAIVAAIGSGITAPGVLDAALSRLRADEPVAASQAPNQVLNAPKHTTAANTAGDYRARLLMLQTGGATFGELWRAAQR